MGMYTEFLFQGESKSDLPKNIQDLFDYFFGEGEKNHIELIEAGLPEHPFFQCPRWCHIGHMSSYYFSPFALRHTQKHARWTSGHHVFFICNLKNYDNEIELFLDWVAHHMNFYWGHHHYEEDEKPTFFTVRR